MYPEQAPLLPLESVELVPEYERMLVLKTSDGMRWHYLQHPSGELELGRPYLFPFTDNFGVYTVHLWAPLAPGALPRVLKVEHQGRP